MTFKGIQDGARTEMKNSDNPFSSEHDIDAKQAAISFASEHLCGEIIQRDREGQFSHQFWGKCAEYGIQGLVIPKEFGGAEAGALALSAVLEGLGYGCRDNGLLFALAAHICAVEVPILKFGSEPQKCYYLPKLGNGSTIGASAITEPKAGSDAFSLQTLAERRGSYYILNGSKSFVTNAAIADLFVVYATIDPSRYRFGITAFLVEKSTPGVNVKPVVEKMGLRTCPISEITLVNCRVPAHNILGVEGAGAMIFQTAMDWERSCGIAWQVGAMERQLEACITYAQERRQFGQAIGKFQSVSNRIADMKMRLELARLILYKAAWTIDQGKHAALETAMAKLFISEAALQNHLDAIRVYGGYGYLTETEIERDLRDAVGGVIYSGTSDLQRVIIARLLGL